VFCFGGKKENGKVTNELKILRIDVREFFWVVPKTKGMPPLPRYQHTMELYEPARFLVIYGGMDDHRNIQNKPAFYTHMGILDLTTFSWLTALVYGDTVPPRCSHVSCFVDSKFIIFGGLYNRGFNKPYVSYFEVNQVNVVNLRR